MTMATEGMSDAGLGRQKNNGVNEGWTVEPSSSSSIMIFFRTWSLSDMKMQGPCRSVCAVFWGEGADSRRTRILDICADLRRFMLISLGIFCCQFVVVGAYIYVFSIADHYHCCSHKIPYCWIQRWSICLSILNWKNICLITYILTSQILHSPKLTLHYAARAMGAMTLRISELCLSFSPHPNIADGNFNLVHHFFRIQIFQINEKGSSWAWIRWRRRREWK